MKSLITAVLWCALVVLGHADCAPGAEKLVAVGTNDYTGQPISMRFGLKHPVTVDYRGRDPRVKPDEAAVTAAKAVLASLDPAVLAAQARAGGPGLMHRAADYFFVLADAGLANGPEASKAVAAANAFLGVWKAEELVKAGAIIDAVARALYLLGESRQKPEDVRKLAEPLYQALLAGGPQYWKKRGGDLNYWNMGPIEVLYYAPYFTAEEKTAIKNQIYWAMPSDSGSNNNGRWGWLMDWPVALAFEDAEIMTGVLKAYKHWLAFNLYASGVPQDWVSYDYCTGGKESALEILSKYLDGLDPATFRVPAYPIADSTQRFGFEDTRDPRKLRGTIWKDIKLFHDRWTNHNAPDDRFLGLNDTRPELSAPPSQNVPNLNVRSVDLRSSAVLRGGPAPDAWLWRESATATSPEQVRKTFWAYLHSDPSDAIHNHYDTNQLLLWWNGEFLAGNSGCDCSHLCGVYNRKNGLYAMQTFSKNTVTVDQRPQYISHGQVIDFVDAPGFRVATTDAGYVYDGVFHQRTVAMLPEYLVDLNLLPARDPADKTAHTFDYMMSGVGQFDRITGWEDFEPDRLWGGAKFKDEQEFLRWPNLLHIYPYITWGFPRQPTKDWDVSWGEDGRTLRMMVTQSPDQKQLACLGRAQLAVRNLNTQWPTTHERLMYGVPKVLVRAEGPRASFLVLYEPHQGKSAIKSWRRLDERACEVELVSGARDLVLLRRKEARHLWLRYVSGQSCYDPPHVQEQRDVLQKIGAAGISKLELKDYVPLEADRPLRAILLDYRSREVLAYVETVQPTRLWLALPQAPLSVSSSGAEAKANYADGRLAVDLPAGVSRLRIELARQVFAGAKPGSINPAELLRRLAPDEVTEATADWKLNTSKLLARFVYRKPYVYADGAYDGVKDMAPWTVAISDDGNLAVAGSHEGFIEALSPDGQRLWRRYLKGNCLLDYNYNAPQLSVGHGHLGNPLAITGDGNRIVAGTDAGMVYCFGRDGLEQWQREVGGRVQTVAVTPDGSRVAVGAGDKILLLDRAGKVLMEKTLNTASIDVLLTRDGGRLFYSGEDATITCLDGRGEQVWQYRPPKTDKALVTGGIRAMYRTAQVFHDIALDATGDTLVGSHADYGIYCFDARTGKQRWRWGAESSQYTVAISDDGRRIASSADGEVFYLDSSGRLLWKFVFATPGYGMKMSRDGSYVAVSGVTGEWFLLSGDGRIVNRTPVRTPEPFGLTMTPDGKRVVLGAIGNEVLVFENAVK